MRVCFCIAHSCALKAREKEIWIECRPAEMSRKEKEVGHASRLLGMFPLVEMDCPVYVVENN